MPVSFQIPCKLYIIYIVSRLVLDYLLMLSKKEDEFNCYFKPTIPLHISQGKRGRNAIESSETFLISMKDHHASALQKKKNKKNVRPLNKIHFDDKTNERLSIRSNYLLRKP